MPLRHSENRKGANDVPNIPHRRRSRNSSYVDCPPEFSSMACKNGMVLEHRLAAAKMLGRPLLKSEFVALRDGDANNLSDDNIVVYPKGTGKRTALTGEKPPVRCFIAGILHVECPENFSSMANVSGLVSERRLKMAEFLGRPLERDEFVFKGKEPGEMILRKVSRGETRVRGKGNATRHAAGK